MMIRSLFLIFLFSALLSRAQNDSLQKVFYPNGKLASEGRIVNGKPDGYWKTFHENGIIKSEGNRRNGQLDGVWKFYSENGKLNLEYEYKEGKKNGFKRVYDQETGSLISEEGFSDDQRNGSSFYYKEGYKFKEVPFVKGKEEGVGKEYNKDGLVITITKYKAGYIAREEKINRLDKFNRKQGTWKEFYPDFSVKKEMQYRDDKLDGYLKEFARDGNLIKAEKYVEGVLQQNVAELIKLDIKNAYYENGRIKSSGTFNKGTPEGITRRYDEEGKIIGGEVYKDGILLAEGVTDEKGYKQGKWKEYYPTGQLKAEGEYLNDRKTGPWTFYHLNGKIEQKGQYTKDGKPTGDWRWYYDSGNLLREESFIKGKPEGQMIEYSDSGKVITKGLFTDGLKEGDWFEIDGDEKSAGVYRNGQKEGKWLITYEENGKTAAEGIYIDGLENGRFSYYHINGKLKEQGDFIMGNKDGNWKRFDTEGLLITTISYDNGAEVKIDGNRIPTFDGMDEK
jgi:antitoxin component YwqK of YwqJK toxin-antitoxin module